MIMKSKELKAYNLPSDNPISSEINAKPTALFLLLIVFGIISLAFSIPISYSSALISIGAICLIATPRVTLIEFYNDYMVVYNRADRNTCIIIYYNEVASWYYSRGATKDALIIEMEDGSIERVNAFSKTIFETKMSKYLKDKHKKIK